MEGMICVEGTDIVWPAPRFEAENKKLLLDAGAAWVPVDIRGPLTEDAENTGAEARPVDMPATTCVGGTENNALPTTCMGEIENDALPTTWVGGTENDGSSTSIREGVWVPW